MSDRHSIAPYPGLRPFRRDEASIFFGREDQIEEMLTRLETQRFLVVVGASGSGKSSLVRAGLLPAIDDGLLMAPEGLRIAVMRPRADPIAELSAALLEEGALGPPGHAVSNPRALIEAALRRGPNGLIQVVEEGLDSEAGAGGLVLVVDQFEEVFRYHDDSLSPDALEESAKFVQLLLTAVEASSCRLRGPRAPIFVVLTMRSDYIGNCAVFPDLPQAMNDSQFLTPCLTRQQYRAAIARPAEEAGRPLSDELVNRLLNEMSGRDGDDQLPVLQHALMRLWHRPPADSTTIELAQYTALKPLAAAGSPLDHALSVHCDEVLFSLPEDERSIAEVLFRMLCEGPSTRDRRHPTTAETVCRVADCSLSQLQHVVDAFRGEGRCFLMPPEGELSAGTVLDISHESLIRNWRTLGKWLEREAEAAEMYRRLLASARRRQNKQESLWRGATLAYALRWQRKYRPTAAWAERYGGSFELSMAFLRDSRRARRWNRVMVIAGFAGLVVLSGLAVGAASILYKTQQTIVQRDGEVRRLASEREGLERDKQSLEREKAGLQAEMARLDREIQLAQQREQEADARLVQARRRIEEAKHYAEQLVKTADQRVSDANRRVIEARTAANHVKEEAERVALQRVVGIPSVDELDALQPRLGGGAP